MPIGSDIVFVQLHGTSSQAYLRKNIFRPGVAAFRCTEPHSAVCKILLKRSENFAFSAINQVIAFISKNKGGDGVGGGIKRLPELRASSAATAIFYRKGNWWKYLFEIRALGTLTYSVPRAQLKVTARVP